MTRRPPCDKEGCERPACVEWYIRWTDGHTTYNVWRACRTHLVEVRDNLSTGRWSGGVVPRTMEQSFFGDAVY